MKKGKSVLAFLLAIFLLTSSFSGVVLASVPVTISNVQTNSFPGFRNDWSAGSGSFVVSGSGGVQLVSTGDQIHLEVPDTAYRGEFEIIVRHGNQFSITTITIVGAVTAWELVGIGVGSDNRVSQVMIGDYRFEQDDDGNPILITPPDDEECEEEEEECDENEACDEEEEEEEECDETFYHLDPDGMTPNAPVVDRGGNRGEEVAPEPEVETDNPESEEKSHYEYCEDEEIEEEIEVEIYIPILPQTSGPSAGTIYIGGALLGVAGLLLKFKSD